MRDYVGETLTLELGRYRKQVEVRWGDPDVCDALLALDRADSITVDPHKLGYLPYACGAVAFRNDRIRHFIVQKAPYVTSSEQNALVHLPPRRIEAVNGDIRVAVEAFAPFILDGSRPGASAVALWLATKMIPLTRQGHGAILRASLLAARELHEWLAAWDEIAEAGDVHAPYRFLPLSGEPPDTNIVVFVTTPKSRPTLKATNALTERVYAGFAIQVEHGAREYSYAQPYFLSRTRLAPPAYSYHALLKFFDRAGVLPSRADYDSQGLTVLRAVAMNPYAHPLRRKTGHSTAREFVREMARVAERNAHETASDA